MPVGEEQKPGRRHIRPLGQAEKRKSIAVETDKGQHTAIETVTRRHYE